VRRGLLCLLTIVRGTPIPGYRHWPLGPPQGRLRPCRWGKAWLTCHFRALADASVANLSSVVLPAPFVPWQAGTWPSPPPVSSGCARGVLLPPPQKYLSAAPRRRAVVRDGLLPGRDDPSSTHSEAGCLVLQVRDMWTSALMSGTESL
jgi:hypothetical protein